MLVEAGWDWPSGCAVAAARCPGCRGGLAAWPSPSWAQRRSPDTLTADAPPGPWSCPSPSWPSFWSPFPINTHPCHWCSVLNTLNEFKDSYSDDSQISITNPGLFWDRNSLPPGAILAYPLAGLSHRNSTITKPIRFPSLLVCLLFPTVTDFHWVLLYVRDTALNTLNTFSH